MSEQLQTYFAVLVILMMMFAVWRQGRANPVDTGTISTTVAQLKERIDQVAGEVASSATSEEVEALRGEMKSKMATMSEKLSHCASKADIAKVETALDHVCKQNDRQEAATVRIEQFLMGTPPARGRKS